MIIDSDLDVIMICERILEFVEFFLICYVVFVGDVFFGICIEDGGVVGWLVDIVLEDWNRLICEWYVLVFEFFVVVNVLFGLSFKIVIDFGYFDFNVDGCFDFLVGWFFVDYFE